MTALAPAEFATAEEQTIKASPAQGWLLSSWFDFWAHVKLLAGIRGKHRKRKLIVCHLGDAVDGLHHGAVQMLPEIVDQQNMFIELFKPIVEIADLVLFTYGTDAHAGQAAQFEKTVCRELGIQRAGYNLTLDVDGVVCDLAHHGRAGGRPWTSSGAGFAAQVAQDYIEDGLRPPRYVFRGHTHRVDDSGERLPFTRYIALPSWQLRTSYGFKVGQGRADVGGIIMMDGVINFARARYTAAPGQREVIRA
jgi:hypothetical protein